jgi:hypothetical protein
MPYIDIQHEISSSSPTLSILQQQHTHHSSSNQHLPATITMLFQNLAIAAALTALTAAQEIEQSDIPQQCTQLCSQVVTIARDCDNRFSMCNIP